MIVLIDRGIFGFWLILFVVSVRYFILNAISSMMLIVDPECIITFVVALLTSIGYVKFCLPNWNP